MQLLASEVGPVGRIVGQPPERFPHNRLFAKSSSLIIVPRSTMVSHQASREADQGPAAASHEVPHHADQGMIDAAKVLDIRRWSTSPPEAGAYWKVGAAKAGLQWLTVTRCGGSPWWRPWAGDSLPGSPATTAVPRKVGVSCCPLTTLSLSGHRSMSAF